MNEAIRVKQGSVLMAIDPNKLQRDAKSLHKTRQRHHGDGTMSAIRTALPAIYRLRKKGVLWREIAAALAKQGVTQGKGKDRKPITVHRLTSLVTQIERGAANERANHPVHLSNPSAKRNALQNPSVSLALDLSAKGKARGRKSTLDEEDIRRAALRRVQSLLRKDK